MALIDTSFSSINKITAALIKEKDWSKTALGPYEAWPSALKQAVRTMLTSPFPMCVAWGKDYIRL
jgi:hypothetical protein